MGKKMYNSDYYTPRESLFSRLMTGDDSPEQGKVSFGLQTLVNGYKENKRRVYVTAIVSLASGIMLSSWLCMLFKLIGQREQIELLGLFTEWFNIPGVIIALLFAIMGCVGTYRFTKINTKNFYYDKDTNSYVSTTDMGGHAHYQTEKERHECFNMSKDIDDIMGDILGIDEKGRLYSLRDDLVGINRNKCIFGTPGSGKSVAIIENDILQCMRRGESAIITDSKGDLYRKLSQKARDAGYIVKVLNLKPNELKNSDAFHLLKYLEDGDTSVAEMLAKCIIENTTDPRQVGDYWALNEMNGYKALLLYISTNEALKKANRNTLAEMYNICTSNTPSQLAALFSGLPKTHPARQAFNIYANCEPKVQGQILNGMGIKLSFLTDFNAQQVVSHDEIDLILPMKRPCMYFVVIPDTNKTYNVIANLFFNMMLIKQCEYSDSLTSIERNKQLYVNYILDEFKATGAINNFDGTITTVRSRKIAISIVLQTLGQLQDMYPGMAYDTILGSMTTKLLLRAGDEATSKYFQMIMGKQTRMSKNKRYSDTMAEAIHTHNSETITEGLTAVDLLPVDEAQKMDADHLIVCVLGFQPVKLLKFLSSKNPYLQEWDETVPARHKPKWRKQMEEDNSYGDGTGMTPIESEAEPQQENAEAEEKAQPRNAQENADAQVRPSESEHEDVHGEQPEKIKETPPAKQERPAKPKATGFPTKPTELTPPKPQPDPTAAPKKKGFRRIQLQEDEVAANNSALDKF